MKTDKLIKFLQENYQPSEELCWQTWCRADFIETGVNETVWKIAVDKFSEYESEDRTVIKDCISDALQGQSDLMLNDEPTIERVDYEILINGVVITGDNPDADYDIVEREDKINDLFDWIAEASPSDNDLMRADLEMLMGLSDEWILSDVGTNSYLALSTEREEFIQQCNTLVDLYKTKPDVGSDETLSDA